MPEDQKNPEQIFSSQGNPFKTEEAARSAMTQKGYSPKEYKIGSYEDGYIIVKKPEVAKEKYYKVMFSHKSNPGDEDDVTLVVNGETLVVQRGVDVIIPGRYRECADHATFPKFTQLPNQARKQVGQIKLFPYSLLGEATEAEYLKQLRDGNRKTQESLARDRKLME